MNSCISTKKDLMIKIGRSFKHFSEFSLAGSFWTITVETDIFKIWKHDVSDSEPMLGWIAEATVKFLLLKYFIICSINFPCSPQGDGRDLRHMTSEFSPLPFFVLENYFFSPPLCFALWDEQFARLVSFFYIIQRRIKPLQNPRDVKLLPICFDKACSPSCPAYATDGSY